MKGEGIRWLPFGLGWERGRPARKASLGARLTLALALSREGRGDSLASVRAWLRSPPLGELILPRGRYQAHDVGYRADGFFLGQVDVAVLGGEFDYGLAGVVFDFDGSHQV